MTTSTSRPRPPCRCPRSASPVISWAGPRPSCSSRRRSATARTGTGRWCSSRTWWSGRRARAGRAAPAGPAARRRPPARRRKSARRRKPARRPGPVSRPWPPRRQADLMRIALFVTCLADTLFPEAGRATVRLLERLGHQVEFPAAQTCCGQMHVNTGYLRDALPLVRRYVEVFSGCEAIVVPSGSCTGSIRHQHAMVARRYGDEALARRAEAVAGRTYELSELLVDVLGVEDVGAYDPHRVTYHPTCHSLRLLRVGDRPLRLLRNVTGIDLVELPDADTCCGFGGTFAVKNADTSCLMHIGGGLTRLQTGTRTVHLAEILASVPQTSQPHPPVPYPPEPHA